MSLYTKWRSLSEDHNSQEEEVKFWEEYLKKETQIYNEILNNKMEVVEGTVTELAAKFNTSVEYIMGFIDGISESLTEDLTEDKLETIEADSAVKLEIDFEKLYYNSSNGPVAVNFVCNLIRVLLIFIILLFREMSS